MLTNMGDIRCGTLPFFRAKEGVLQPDGTVSKKWPTIPGYTNVNVCSNGTTYKNLSPMKLGPFNLIEVKCPTPFYPSGIHPGFVEFNETHQIIQVMNVENYFQSSKVFNIDIKDGIVQPSFFERRAKFMADPKGHRRVIPKKKGYPVAAYFEGQLLSYVSSRIYYIKAYESLALMTPEYQDLLRKVNNGEKIHILGFDGRDPATGLSYGANPITYKILEEAMYDPRRPFGHELVLCGMLLNMRPWENFDFERAANVTN